MTEDGKEFDEWWSGYVAEKMQLPEFQRNMDIDLMVINWEIDWDHLRNLYMLQGESEALIAERKKKYFDYYGQLIWDAFQYVPCCWGPPPKSLPKATWTLDSNCP